MRLRALAAAALVVGVALGSPATAAAALPTTATVQAAGYDYTPSSNKFREFMLNVTSSLLKGAMPKGWKAEQLANQYRYNHAWESLNAQFGYDTANPNYGGSPDSYDDYVIRRHEMDMKGGTGGKPFGAPATSPSKWSKMAKVGGGLSALTLFPLGVLLGNLGVDLAGGWFGFDAAGQVCQSVQQEGGAWELVAAITGRDCSLFDFDPDFFPLPDYEWCARKTGNTAYGCLRYTGVVITPTFGGARSEMMICGTFRAEPNLTSSYDVRGALEFENNAAPTQTWGAWMGNGNQPFGACTDGYVTVRSFMTPEPPTVKEIRVEVQDGPGQPWHPAEKREVEGSGDSEDQLKCTVTMTDGTKISTTGKTYSWKSGGQIAPPACPEVPDGKIPNDVTVTDKGGKKTGGGPTTEEYKKWKEDYPECGTGACKLDLILKPKASCFDLEYKCEGWFDDPNKTDKYQCKYGVKNVSLKECNVYAGLFEKGRVNTGTPYSDPDTGMWSGGKNALDNSKKAYRNGIQDPAKDRTCNDANGDDGHFDPIGFIMRPIQCALEWAFVPRPVWVEVKLSGGETAWQHKPPAVIASAVGSLAPAAHSSGCSRTVTIFAGWAQTTIKPLDTCAGSWAAPLATASKVITSAAMVILVVVVVRRQISGMVGYGAGQ